MLFVFHFYDLKQRAGIQRAICELANALIERGDQVVIATHSARSEAAYHLDERVIVEQTPYAEYPRHGPLAWLMRGIWGIAQVGALRKIAKRYHPSLIIDHGTALGLIYPFRLLGGAPLVLQRHFPVQNFPFGGVLYRLLSVLIGRKTVVVLTERISRDLRLLRYSRVAVIPNVVPAEARPVPYGEAVPKTALLMGRGGNPQKGFDLFLEALAIAKMEGWRFTLIGPGVDSDPVLQRLVRKNRLEASVSLLPATNVPLKYLREASCVIMPSRYEALPMLAFEALSVGRPVIASDADGLRDLIVDDVNGLTFPCGDVSRLSKCLERISNDQPLLERLAGCASVSVEPFQTNSIIEKWRKLASGL